MFFCTATLILWSYLVLISWVLLRGVQGLFCSFVQRVLSTDVVQNYCNHWKQIRSGCLRKWEVRLNGVNVGELENFQTSNFQYDYQQAVLLSPCFTPLMIASQHCMEHLFHIYKIAVWPKLSNMCVGELKITPFNCSTFWVSPSSLYYVILKPTVLCMILCHTKYEVCICL